MTISNVKNPLGAVIPSAVSDLARRTAEAAREKAAVVKGAVKQSVGDLARRTAEAAREKGAPVAKDAAHVASVFVHDLPSAALDKRAQLEHAAARKLGTPLAKTGALGPFDTKKKIGELQPGDSWKLGVGAKGAFEDAGASASDSTTVTRNQDGSFTVATNADAAAGLTKTGQGSELSATLGAGARIEYRFATAADAERGSLALHRARAGLASPAELKSLTAHLSAFELSGNEAAEFAAKSGVPPLASSNSVGAVADRAVRVELTHPPKMVVRDTLSATLNRDAGLKAGGASARVAGASVEVKAVAERRFTLPGLDPAAFARAPGAALKKGLASAVRSEHDAVTLSVGAKGNVMGDGGGASAKVSFDYPADALTSSGALDTLLTTGDLSSAAPKLGDATHVTASLATSTTRGVAVSGGVGTSELGGKASFESTTTHNTTVWQYPAAGAPPATLTDACRALSSLPPARKAFSVKP